MDEGRATHDGRPAADDTTTRALHKNGAARSRVWHVNPCGRQERAAVAGEPTWGVTPDWTFAERQTMRPGKTTPGAGAAQQKSAPSARSPFAFARRMTADPIHSRNEIVAGPDFFSLLRVAIQRKIDLAERPGRYILVHPDTTGRAERLEKQSVEGW
jgi:hypothetical protein